MSSIQENSISPEAVNRYDALPKPMSRIAQSKMARSLLVLSGIASGLHSDASVVNYEYVSVTSMQQIEQAWHGEQPICTTASAAGESINLGCVDEHFPAVSAATSDTLSAATVSIYLTVPKMPGLFIGGGSVEAEATGVKLANDASGDTIISAGHDMPDMPTASSGSTCGGSSNIENGNGLEADLAGLEDSFKEYPGFENIMPIGQFERANELDVSLGVVKTNKSFTNLSSVFFVGNALRKLRIGDPLIITSDEPDPGNGPMRGQRQDNPSMAQPDLIKAVYAGVNKYDPTTFFVLTGFGSLTESPGEMTVPIAGASGSSVSLPDLPLGVGDFVGGRTSGTNTPVSTTPESIRKQTGVTVTGSEQDVYLNVVQALPGNTLHELAQQPFRSCNN